MARARNLKPGFFKNEDLAECTPWARLCFAGLWLLADREGRLEDRPKRIKGELFPFDSFDVEPLLGELAKHGFIVRYEVDGQRCIAITAFSKHQAPHFTEKPSILPEPPGDSAVLPEKAPPPGDDWPPQTKRQAAMALYFIRREGARPAIKIGVSGDVQARLRQIRSQRGNETAALLFTVAQTDEVNERTLHRALKEHRLDGEWFALNDAVIGAVLALKDNALPVAGDPLRPVRYPLNPSSPNPSSPNPSSPNPEARALASGGAPPPPARAPGSPPPEEPGDPRPEPPDPSAPPPGANGHAPTAAGTIARAMRKAGMAVTNPGDPRFLALIAQGATEAEFVDLAGQAARTGKGWAWVLVALQNRRTEAAGIRLAPAPAAEPQGDDWETRGGVERIAARVGIGPWDETVPFPTYRARVRAKMPPAQGPTP